ncbi:SPW repeat protein [Thermobispora bispora]|nr:SPW repeat protein [Thermobispora bispora]MBO2474956.1 hypothetical protein [Actinomycetales bacterium]MBX6357954.1 SPW repeat protein [Micromonosporaceae bacterium]MDI9580265.1 SPW repeat protein [Thermobispora sp.]QSI48169.1 hypothetical protein CYL17_10155 [Thermobispora bispora]
MVRPAGVEHHPDVAELRRTYDEAGSTPPAQMMDGLTLLAGVYLAISPWIVGFVGNTALTVNNLIVGLMVAALALGCAWAFGRTYGVSWVIPLLGLWTIFSPWLVRGGDVRTGGMITNNIITGIVILVLGLAAMMVAMRFRSRGRR